MTTNAIIQMQLALQEKREHIRINADIIYDKLIVKVRHGIESIKKYSLKTVIDLQSHGSNKKTGNTSVVNRKMFLYGLIDGSLPHGWPIEELLHSVTKIMYVLSN